MKMKWDETLGSLGEGESICMKDRNELLVEKADCCQDSPYVLEFRLFCSRFPYCNKVGFCDKHIRSNDISRLTQITINVSYYQRKLLKIFMTIFKPN